MSPLRAVLLFPVQPAAAAGVLRGRHGAGAAALLPPCALGAYLSLRGCGPADALAAAVALLAVTAGLGLGGALGSAGAGLLLARPIEVRPHLACSLVFAAWTVVLFPALVVLLGAAGAGALAGLGGGLALLTWGVVAGLGVLGVDEGPGPRGRGLVVSCTALSGALLGLCLAGWGATQLVWPWRAPVAVDGGRAGQLLLVVRDRNPGPADLLLARDPAGATVLARRAAGGPVLPVGGPRAAGGPWRPLGRVFFRFGGPWGGSALGRPHPRRQSHCPPSRM